MAEDFEWLKAQKDAIAASDLKRAMQPTLTRIYDILAGINDDVQIGDDGYVRFGSTSDADQLRDLVQELEADALTYHGAQGVSVSQEQVREKD